MKALLSLSALTVASIGAASIEGLPVAQTALSTACLTALQDALCLLEFTKCESQSPATVPVCWSVRDHVARACYDSFEPLQLSSKSVADTQPLTIAHIQDTLFSHVYNDRWAASALEQEPLCVSFTGHGSDSAAVDNIHVIDDLVENNKLDQTQDQAEEERWLRVQSAADPKADQGGLFAFSTEDDAPLDDEEVEMQTEVIKATLQARSLSRRDRGKQQHHHHKQQQQHHNQQQQHTHHHEKRSDGSPVDPSPAANSAKAAQVHIRADDTLGQAVYTISKDEASTKAFVGNMEAKNGDDTKAMDDQQRVLAETGSQSTEAKAGQPGDKDAAAAPATEGQEEAAHPRKGTVLLAAIPILLVMGAIAGFTAYRRYYENSFNQGGRNDTRDDASGDDYHRRDVPNRKSSPIHFDRTFMNMMHSPPPTATYLHDPENSSRHHSPSANNMKRPPPSAGSHGKTRFQELSRSYDFAAFRTIKNALTRSSNNSRDSALDQASGSGSNDSLQGKTVSQAFGAGGHSIAKIGSHPGLTVLERQQLQQHYGAGRISGASSVSGSASKFSDVKSLDVPQEHAIIWGQYSANDDTIYHQDAASAVASNLARRSGSSNSLSGSKYSHHHQQSSGHHRDMDSDSIGDCLSPESPTMTREEMMRRRDLLTEGYSFGSEGSGSDDVNSGTDLLFDARDHLFDLGVEKEAVLRDEEMDMILSMEKEESPYVFGDHNTTNPNPYEPKVLNRHFIEQTLIQRSAAVDDAGMDEKKALEAEYKTEAAAAVAEETIAADPEVTHVLGSDSPEWNSNSGHPERDGLVEQVMAKDAFGQVRSALGCLQRGIDSKGLIVAEVVDPHEWEEEPRSSPATGTTAQGAGQGSGQGKKKGNKSKAKKGRKH
ncbi:hypothetical protein BGZ72_000663 [Mortierella alpina]|nr:hypothetical protein BGZ72_000663 [Mortierella alpina]